MRLRSKWIVAPAAGLVLLVGGIGVASAMAGDDRSATVSSAQPVRTDDRTADDHGAMARRDGDGIGGAPVQRAAAAAVAAVPGATVREVERASGARGAAYHVELIQRDGTRAEVDLNASFEPIQIERSGHHD
jgi:hypothetical protein